MDTTVLQQLKESIAQQRQNLVEWLNGTPAEAKQLRTGSAGEQAVHEHLRTLETALQKADEKTLRGQGDRRRELRIGFRTRISRIG